MFNRQPSAASAAAVVDMRRYNELLETTAEPDVATMLHCMTEQVCLPQSITHSYIQNALQIMLQVCTSLAEGTGVQSVAPSNQLDKDISKQLDSILSVLSPVPLEQLKKVHY